MHASLWSAQEVIVKIYLARITLETLSAQISFGIVIHGILQGLQSALASIGIKVILLSHFTILSIVSLILIEI